MSKTKTKQETVAELEAGGDCPSATCPACGCKDTEDPGWECPREKCPIRKRNAWHQHEADEAKRKRETAMAAAIGAGYCGHLRLLNAGSDAPKKSKTP